MNHQVTTFRTARNTPERFAQLAPLSFHAMDLREEMAVVVDKGKRFQEIEGFGGAFTEAAAVTLLKMRPEQQEEILQAYFHPQAGIGYSLCRTHINSCDFSLGNYAYTEVPGDIHLEHFDISRDRQALIPMIRRAQRIAGDRLRLFASPWSPPPWMKTNGEMNHGGKLKAEYRQVWAEYYCRYIAEYAREGIPIWGVSVQNEPMAVQRWDSCTYTAEEERDFVRDYLGPTLEHNGLGDVRVIIWDHNRDLVYERARVVLGDAETARFVWGVGFHWYITDRFENIQMVHEVFPDKKLLFTEGCQEGGTHLGEWEVGERYGRSIIQDLNHWTVGWVDWNMVLDEKGGPNHVGNYCSAPIIADTVNQKIHYQSSYYYIGHFSRFIQRGARRVVCTPTRDELEATAFENPDGNMVVVVMNQCEADIPFKLMCGGEGVELVILAHSIMTCVF